MWQYYAYPNHTSEIGNAVCVAENDSRLQLRYLFCPFKGCVDGVWVYIQGFEGMPENSNANIDGFGTYRVMNVDGLKSIKAGQRQGLQRLINWKPASGTHGQ